MLRYYRVLPGRRGRKGGPERTDVGTAVMQGERRTFGFPMGGKRGVQSTIRVELSFFMDNASST